MKRLFFLFGSLFALAAFAPPAPPPPPAALEPPAGATTYFDGSYTGQSIQNISGVTPVPCAKFSVAPALTIGNGVARFCGARPHVSGICNSARNADDAERRRPKFRGTNDPYFVRKGRLIGNWSTRRSGKDCRSSIEAVGGAHPPVRRAALALGPQSSEAGLGGVALQMLGYQRAFLAPVHELRAYVVAVSREIVLLPRVPVRRASRPAPVACGPRPSAPRSASAGGPCAARASAPGCAPRRCGCG